MANEASRMRTREQAAQPLGADAPGPFFPRPSH